MFYPVLFDTAQRLFALFLVDWALDDGASQQCVALLCAITAIWNSKSGSERWRKPFKILPRFVIRLPVLEMINYRCKIVKGQFVLPTGSAGRLKRHRLMEAGKLVKDGTLAFCIYPSMYECLMRDRQGGGRGDYWINKFSVFKNHLNGFYLFPFALGEH